MPDITMCNGEGCGIKATCYRFTATPSEFRQAYFVTPPFTVKMDGTACYHYWLAETRFNPCDNDKEVL